ncbi:hypothetical protein HFX_2542 [Haloferax mediterranei ATCC 33500]|uniref:Uncharacterized protein n=1 Tax=Haloferax mediterranei (strain ATCC 33500 / DSM 1411 / JCM 8866 / NBRC 14739 / NCIMB 2177 / R-4) TaxID=523841 RepID=I3R7L3_HALMT|nr:hypothetical protein HFX_2542 [Haloferax mediterranei ATCC 33500]
MESTRRTVLKSAFGTCFCGVFAGCIDFQKPDTDSPSTETSGASPDTRTSTSAPTSQHIALRINNFRETERSGTVSVYRHSPDGEADITRITATPPDDSVQVTHHSWRIPPAEQTTYESVFRPGTAYLLQSSSIPG